jgi:hypothetical protein
MSTLPDLNQTQGTGGTSGVQNLQDLYTLINGKSNTAAGNQTTHDSGGTTTGTVKNSGSTNTSLSDVVGSITGTTNGTTSNNTLSDIVANSSGTNSSNTAINTLNQINQNASSTSVNSSSTSNTQTTRNSGSTNVTTTTGKLDQAGMDAMLKSMLEGNNGLASTMMLGHSAGVYDSATQGQLVNDMTSRMIGEIAKANETQTTTQQIGGSTSTTSGSSSTSGSTGSNTNTTGTNQTTGTNSTTGSTTNNTNQSANTTSNGTTNTNTNQNTNNTTNTTNTIGGSQTDSSTTTGPKDTSTDFTQVGNVGGVTAGGVANVIGAGVLGQVTNGIVNAGGSIVNGIINGGGSAIDGAGGVGLQEGGYPDLTGDSGLGLDDLGINLARGGLVTKPRTARKGYADGGLVQQITDNDQLIQDNQKTLNTLSAKQMASSAISLAGASDNPIQQPAIVKAATNLGGAGVQVLSNKMQQVDALGTDQQAQFKKFVSGATSGSDSMTMNGRTFGVMGVQTNDEGGGSFTPNSGIEYDPGKVKPGDAYYKLDDSGNRVGMGKWENGSDAMDLIKGTVKDLAPIVLTAMGMYAGVGGLAGLAGGSATAGNVLASGKFLYGQAKNIEKTGMAGGGKVVGPGTATSDSVPINASDGEFVVNAAAVQKVGLPST